MPKQKPPGANRSTDSEKEAEDNNTMEEDPNSEPPPGSEAPNPEGDGGSPCEAAGAAAHSTSTSPEVLRATEEGKNPQKDKRNFQMPPLARSPSSSGDMTTENVPKEKAATLLGGASKDDVSPKTSAQGEGVDPKSHDPTLGGKSELGLRPVTYGQQTVVASARTFDSNCPPDALPFRPSDRNGGSNKHLGEISPHIPSKPETPKRSSPNETRSRESARGEGKSGVKQAPAAESRGLSDGGERISPQSLSSSQHTDPAPQASRARQTQTRKGGAERGARSPPTDGQAKPEDKLPSSSKVADEQTLKNQERVASHQNPGDSGVPHKELRTSQKDLMGELGLLGQHEIVSAGGRAVLEVYPATTSDERSPETRPLQQSPPQSASQSSAQSTSTSSALSTSTSSPRSTSTSSPQSTSTSSPQSTSTSSPQSTSTSSPWSTSTSSSQSTSTPSPQSTSTSSPRSTSTSSPQSISQPSPWSTSTSSSQSTSTSSSQSASTSSCQSTLRSDAQPGASASCSTHEQTTNKQTTSPTGNHAPPDRASNQSPRTEGSLLPQNRVPQASPQPPSRPGAGPVQASASPPPCSRRQPSPVWQPRESLSQAQSEHTSPSAPPNSQQRPVLVLRRVPPSSHPRGTSARPRGWEAHGPGLRPRGCCVIRSQYDGGRQPQEDQQGSRNTPSVFVVDLHQRAVDMRERRDLPVDARDLLTDIDLQQQRGLPREITRASDLILRSWGPYPGMTAGNAEWAGLPARFQGFLDEGLMGRIAAFLAALTPGGTATVLCVVCQVQEVNVHLFPCHHRPLCRLCLVRGRLCRCPLQHCCQLIAFFFQFRR